MADFDNLVRNIAPINRFDVSHARGAWTPALVRINGGDFSLVKSKNAIVVISKSCSSLAVLPNLFHTLYLTVIRDTHDVQDLVLVVSNVDERRFFLQTSTGRY